MVNTKFVVKSTSKEVNVILLGESGVGKSTFINALANYYQSSSFEQAEKNKLKCLIPAHFTITDENFNTVKIELGSHANESNETGMAATQNAMSHYIKISNEITLHVIDTPGVGDPGGINKDKANFKNTIEYISRFKSLNGIVVLLKPNNSRLDLHFRYCFKELLVHLHKNAAPNILFCFTNARSTFYRPGDTLPALEKLVKDIAADSKIRIPLGFDNMFCFDNEAFRFLAAVQQGVHFSQEDKNDFSTSWKKSVDASSAFIKYITGLSLHEIQSTVNLNKARTLLLELAKPIAEISQNIQTNIKLASDKKKELQNGNFDLEDLKKRLQITQIGLEPNLLGYPRTVCTDPSCTRVITIGESTKVDYVTHCHPHCYLDGVKQECINNVELKQCACMSNNVCKVCSHDWSVHMHISYENKQVEVQVVDTNIQSMIDQKCDTHKLIEASIDSIQDLIKELEEEQREIINISAKFARFTHKNAIAVFNDDLDAYLDLLIREEESKRQSGAQNDQVLAGLRNVKQNYIEQKKIFTTTLQQNVADDEISSEDIDDLIDELFNLPLNGATIKSVVDTLKSSRHKP